MEFSKPLFKVTVVVFHHGVIVRVHGIVCRAVMESMTEEGIDWT